MKKTFYDQLQDADVQKNKKDRVKTLQKYSGMEIKTLLDFTFNPKVVWDLPEGEPPYVPSKESEAATTLRLAAEVRKLSRFLKSGPYAKLPRKRKESLFIDLLESIHPMDAKLMIAIKDKKLPFKNITKEIVAEAFPIFTKNW